MFDLGMSMGQTGRVCDQPATNPMTLSFQHKD